MSAMMLLCGWSGEPGLEPEISTPFSVSNTCLCTCLLCVAYVRYRLATGLQLSVTCIRNALRDGGSNLHDEVLRHRRRDWRSRAL